MSKGNKPILVRLTQEMEKAVKDEIKRINLNRRGEPWTVSSWIRQAVRDKLHHTERSRNRRKTSSFRCAVCKTAMTEDEYLTLASRRLNGVMRLVCKNCEQHGDS